MKRPKQPNKHARFRLMYVYFSVVVVIWLLLFLSFFPALKKSFVGHETDLPKSDGGCMSENASVFEKNICLGLQGSFIGLIIYLVYILFFGSLQNSSSGDSKSLILAR